jgi:hypothetical protein
MTKQPQKLIEITELAFTALLDLDDWNNFITEVGTNQSLSLTVPDEGTLQFWGYLKDIVPDAGEKGVEWKISGNIVPTCMNAADVETAPVFTAS